MMADGSGDSWLDPEKDQRNRSDLACDGARPDREAVGRAEAAGLVYPTISHRDEVIAAALAAHAEICRDLPVVAIQRFDKDVVVKKTAAPGWRSKGRPQGAAIKELSHQSRFRYLHTARNCGIEWRSLPTMTYPAEYPRDGAKVKRDRDLLNKWFRRNFFGCRGIWHMEFQRRGAPHFHDLSDIDLASYGPLVRRVRLRPAKEAKSKFYWTNPELEAALAEAWYRIVGSGDKRHLRAGVSWEVCDSSEGAIRYAAMHAAKPHQKTVPPDYQNLGRFWACYGGVRVPPADFELISTGELFRVFGPDAMSSKGKVKKYLWDVPGICSQR